MAGIIGDVMLSQLGLSLQSNRHRVGDGLAAICRLGIGALLIYSGVAKAIRPGDFLGALYAYQVLSHPVARGAAVMIPWLEIVLGAALLMNRLTLGALASAAGLFAIFTGALMHAFARGMPIECGCFGISEQPKPIGLLIVARTACLMVITFWLTVRLIRMGNLIKSGEMNGIQR